MAAAALERRNTRRVPFKGKAFFENNGVIEKLLIKDFSDEGVGAYAFRDCSVGQQGLLLVKFSASSVRRYISEVAWCKSNTSDNAGKYPFCLGLRILA